MEDVGWNIENFETNKGEKVVDEFVIKQQSSAKAKIIHAVKLLKTYGNKLGLPHSKSLGDGLYELRIRGKQEIRILYCFRPGRTIYLLHAFKKQTQQTPQKELDTTLKRLKSLTSV